MDTTTADPNNHSRPNNQADQRPDSPKLQPPDEPKHPALVVSQAIPREVPNSLSDRHHLLDTLQEGLQIKDGHKDRQVPDRKADIPREGPQDQRSSLVDIHRKDRKHRPVDRKDQLQDSRDTRRVDRRPKVQLQEHQHLVVINNRDRNDQGSRLHRVHQFPAAFTRLQVGHKPRHTILQPLLCKTKYVSVSGQPSGPQGGYPSPTQPGGGYPAPGQPGPRPAPTPPSTGYPGPGQPSGPSGGGYPESGQPAGGKLRAT